MVAAVTCDIIDSRKYSNEDRRKVNELIKSSFDDCIELLPKARADKLSFSIIQGDEFQFVIQNPALVYQFVVYYRLILALNDLKPSFRAGIGLGEISISGEDSYKMDGSAFHNSRDAIQKINTPKHKNRITNIISGNKDLDAQFEIIAMYNDFIEQRWSDKQRKSIYLYKKLGSLEKAATNEAISYQAMQQRIRISGYQQLDIGFINYQSLLIARL